jgi:hypothetical protein
LSSVDDGVPQIPEVVHLAARTPPTRTYAGSLQILARAGR